MLTTSVVMSNLSEWWEGLNLALKIYWAIAIPFTFFFILQLFFSFVGDHDVPDDPSDLDGHDLGAGFGYHLFTVKSVIAFLTIFGWAGIASIDGGVSHWWSFGIAAVCGFAMMVIMATLLYILSKANANHTMNFNKAVGETGHVYLTIPAHRASAGQVQLKVQGVLRTLDAITDDEKDLPNGKTIVVMRVLNDNTLLVTEK